MGGRGFYFSVTKITIKKNIQDEARNGNMENGNMIMYSIVFAVEAYAHFVAACIFDCCNYALHKAFPKYYPITA